MIDLVTAVDQIVRTAQDRREQRFPFFILFGAGVSSPAIPLASKIEQMAREEIARRGYPQPSTTLPPQTRYSAVLRTAYPQAIDRQVLFRRLALGKEPTPATWELAHLLGSEGLASLAITPNFDKMLFECMDRLERETVVFDHPAASFRLLLDDPRAQIVHMHGSLDHYDLHNLEREIETQARRMAPLLDHVLFSLSPIVVGYSGWNEDVFMRALRRRLENDQPIRRNLYWFAYTREDAESLPPWLTNHPGVQLVLPVLDSTLPAHEVFGSLRERLGIRLAAPSPAYLDPSALLPQTRLLGFAESRLALGEISEAVQALKSVDLRELQPAQRAFCDSLLRSLDVKGLESEDRLATAQMRQKLSELSLEETLSAWLLESWRMEHASAQALFHRAEAQELAGRGARLADESASALDELESRSFHLWEDTTGAGALAPACEGGHLDRRREGLPGTEAAEKLNRVWAENLAARSVSELSAPEDGRVRFLDTRDRQSARRQGPPNRPADTRDPWRNRLKRRSTRSPAPAGFDWRSAPTTVAPPAAA